MSKRKFFEMIKDNIGALSDLRVIEMGQLLAGPFCGQLLGDFGAEIIKVEPPKVGDPMRQWGREKPHGKSLWWPVVARNKKSITVNLRVEEGQEIIKDIIKSTDILIENFRPGTLERWNIGYDVLSKINPRLVMVRVSGYGQTGPYSNRAGFGAIGEAMGGLRYVSGDPSTPPSRMGISIGDQLAAMHACMGALMAIHARERTGKGQVVDSAIYESVLNMMESLVTEHDVAGYTRERTGAIIPNVAPSNIFETKDEQMILIGANQDRVFSRLCDVMDAPELASDERYKSHTARGKNQTQLDDLINEWTKSKTLKEVEDLCNKNGIPAGLIYRAKDMIDDPHFKARKAIIDIEHPVFGMIKMQNVAPKLSENPGEVCKVGPELGEHNNYVFKEILKKSEEELITLEKNGVI